MSESSTHLRDLLSASEYAEHQRLVERLHLLELAQSNTPMSQQDLARLMGLSQQTISLIERTAKWKLREQLTQNHPNLKKELTA